MNYQIKRKNNIIATIRPEGQLQTGVMGEEIVTMTFSLKNYIHFQMGDTVQVYDNIYYLATEPQVEKISSREFRYSLEFQGIKYELGKVQYLLPDAQNVLNLSEFHIMGTAQTMLELLIQNANRTGQGWTLGTIDPTQAKQLNFSAENCLAVLSKIAQEFKLEYWVDGDKSIHLTKRKTISGYSFEYGKAKGLKSITRQILEVSNIVTRLYAFGSEKNIPSNYRNGQQKLRMAVPYLEKNTHIYGVIEGAQTFDVFPHRLGTVTAINPSNPLQFTDSGMDFDLNERENGNTKYLINGVPVKITFHTGQLAGYTFEVKQFGYNSATKTFTLLKNTDEKNIEVPSETLRPAIGDRYVLTDLIMPEIYVISAEQELQQKAQEYLNENSRQRVIYSMTTDPLYFREQNVNITLGSTIRTIDTDFNLDDNLRVIRLTKDLQNPYNVQFEVAERAEIAYIVRNHFEVEKSKNALVQADKFNAEMARRAYRFGREISENVFDAEGYFDTEKIKPLSIETKLLSIGSRTQQFSLPDVVISVENTTSVRNTQGKIVHLTLEQNPRQWLIPNNVQTNISAEFNYIYIKAQKIGSNASVWVSPEKINVEDDPVFYHFEAGYLGRIENGQRRIRMSHGFTQINPFEITTGRIAPPSGNHYIELGQDSIHIVGNVTFSDTSPAIHQIKTAVSPDLLNLENRLKQYTDNIQIGGRNLLLKSNIPIVKNNGEQSYCIGKYFVSQLLEMGETYTLVFRGKTQSTDGVIPFTGDEILNDLTSAKIEGNTSKTYVKKFKITTLRRPISTIEFYNYPNNSTASSTIEWACLYQGDVNPPLTWTPAPEDTISAINQAKTATQNYALQQAELVKTLALAHADDKISQSEQRQIDNAIQKLQEAKNFAQQKVNDLQVGGRNLILNSQINEASNVYGFATRTAHLEAGQTYTLSANGRCENVSPNKLLRVFIFRRDWTWSEYFGISETTDTTRHIVFQPPITGEYLIRFYYSDKSQPREGNVVVNWVKLEKGNKPTDWTPAPQDADQRMTDIHTDLDTALKKAQKILEQEQTNIRSLEEKSKKTDFISGQTSLNGNYIATGVLEVGSQNGAKAGMNGAGTLEDEVRFWAGDNFVNRNRAPFKVLDNGQLHATNAHISGHIEATSGQIGGKQRGIQIKTDGSVQIGSFEDDEDGGFVLGKNFDNQDALQLFKTEGEGIPDNFRTEHTAKYSQWSFYRAGKNIAKRLSYFGLQGMYRDRDENTIFSDAYVGGAFSNVIETYFGATNSFVFTSASPFINVYLPSAQKINQTFRNMSNLSFKIEIVCAWSMQGRLRIRGVNGGAILDNNANRFNGEYGHIDMERGDTLCLRFYGVDYYVMSFSS